MTLVKQFYNLSTDVEYVSEEISTALSEKLKKKCRQAFCKDTIPIVVSAISSIPTPFSKDNYRGDYQKLSDYFVTEAA
jgi:hypothetical protein